VTRPVTKAARLAIALASPALLGGCTPLATLAPKFETDPGLRGNVTDRVPGRLDEGSIVDIAMRVEP